MSVRLSKYDSLPPAGINWRLASRPRRCVQGRGEPNLEPTNTFLTGSNPIPRVPDRLSKSPLGLARICPERIHRMCGVGLIILYRCMWLLREQRRLEFGENARTDESRGVGTPPTSNNLVEQNVIPSSWVDSSINFFCFTRFLYSTIWAYSTCSLLLPLVDRSLSRPIHLSSTKLSSVSFEVITPSTGRKSGPSSPDSVQPQFLVKF